MCITKNFIRTTLKDIFSIFRFFCTLRFQIYKYCTYHNKPYINGKMIYSALMTGFVLRGHSGSYSSYLSAGIKQKGEDLLSGAPRALALPQQVWGRTVGHAGVGAPHLSQNQPFNISSACWDGFNWNTVPCTYRYRLAGLQDKLGSEFIGDFLSICNLSLQSPAAQRLILHLE